jgi:hypothetical protein
MHGQPSIKMPIFVSNIFTINNNSMAFVIIFDLGEKQN